MLNEKERIRIEEIFKSRMINNRIKYSSRKFFELQTEFFSGAMTALNILPPIWTISIMSGREIIEPYKL